MGSLHVDNLFQTHFADVFGLGTLEIFVEGKEGEWLQFSKDAAERGFNPVNMVEENASIHL